MPDIKLKNGSGVEQVYTGVDTITVPLADGTGSWTFGLKDEDLVFTDGTKVFYDNRFANSIMLPENRKRIKFQLGGPNGDSMIATFAESDWEDLSEIEITYLYPDKAQVNKLAYVFENCTKLKKLPVITNETPVQLFGNQSSFDFYNCYVLPADEIKKVLSCFVNSSIFQRIDWFRYCYQLRDMSWFAEVANNLFNYKVTNAFTTLFGYCINLETVVFPVINKNYATTSNLFGTSSSVLIYEANRLTDFRFETQEDGTPYPVEWKSQVLEFSYASAPCGYSDGYRILTLVSDLQNYCGIGSDKNVFYNQTDSSATIDLDAAAARYQALKDDPDWYSAAYNTVTYEGSSVPAARLFSRYNHDSMVETINSLPDTSAYLATAGGTNTIKFSKYCGALTDAGGPEQLTDAEIAVATAKGWTVTIV